MGIDHGLGGRDSKKSQERRAKKAMRTSAIAKAAIAGKKREVIFDEAARVGEKLLLLVTCTFIHIYITSLILN